MILTCTVMYQSHIHVHTLSLFHFVSPYSFKKGLGAGLTREKTLEQSKAQLQLDWEGRMEEVERRAYGKHQSIIGQLTEAKDKVCHSSYDGITCKCMYGSVHVHTQHDYLQFACLMFA